MHRWFRIFALFGALIGSIGLLPSTAGAASPRPHTPAAQVQVDGVTYTHAQFTARFGTQQLHWVVTPTILAAGTPTAFTTEAKLNRAMGSPATERAVGIAATSAVLYQYANLGGRALTITGNAYNLTEQDFNDRTSSVTAYRTVTLYQHSQMRGCSFRIIPPSGGYLIVWDLADWSYCDGGSWDNRTSSVRVG